ncbi:uncharacterized protein PHACADRAFT_263603 [Phanerochaete carnosa HHB-10118-sp]|uniref:enoyl-[acyl-carrier-protein] reductase n=1 Tax=Phanerochaete carnosa (strain HHB-10118-sp) TaxID=650164 RepID=K5VUW5_PHACS|nr:uncharacterized protein PHACADRAFT_263603 [Phanerochaete carnosa HHB-10118-sp]EKM50354.1 hypothetical protein PHACADRAFT_263603 [Phanerochaete carnosa HHB-10118-sp]
MNHSRALGSARGFATSSARQANRAVVYTAAGDPTSVLSVVTYPELPTPPPRSVNVRYVLSPVNPSDINVIEGVYPAKPALADALAPGHRLEKPVYVCGNEGLAEVTEVGGGVQGVHKGDWVVMAGQQLGTWASARTLKAEDVIKVPSGVSEVNGATMTVNPPTAYNMLHDFVTLQEGDWVMQNGANSTVGQAVIQIAAKEGLKTLNFIRNRKDLDSQKQQLKSLGATEVLTYDDLDDKSLRERVKEMTGGKPIRLLLNCVSGPPTTQMLKFLGPDAHLVSYGAMSKQPLSLPTSAFIFKDLACHGFWQSRWYTQHSRPEREALMQRLADMKLKEPEHEVVTIPAQESDSEATRRVHEIMKTLTKGQHGKKILLKIEQP